MQRGGRNSSSSSSITVNESLSGVHIIMSADHGGYCSAESGRKHHGLQGQQQHHSGSVSPPPRSQSPPATLAKQFPSPSQQQQQRFPVFGSPLQDRAFAMSQTSSPTTYKVSPITYENTNETPAFNPQSPYRSMAPSQSRFFDSSTLSSPNDPQYRNMGSEVASSSPMRFGRVITSPQSSTSLHSSRHSFHQLHMNAVEGNLAQPSTTAAELGFTTVPANTNAQHPTGGPQITQDYRGGVTSQETPLFCPGRSGAVQAGKLTSPVTPGSGRPHFFAQRPHEEWSSQPQHVAAAASGAGRRLSSPGGSAAASPILLPRKQPENVSPAVNSSLQGRLPTSAEGATPAHAQAQTRGVPSGTAAAQQRSSQQGLPLRGDTTALPRPPPHANMVDITSSPLRESTPLTESSAHAAVGSCTRASESAGRWVSPLRPHRGASAASSDGFQSPGSAPPSSDTPNTHASAPPPPPRSPAMYGVIGLPYAHADVAAATGSVGGGGSACSNNSGSVRAAAASPTMQLLAVPSSPSSRAPAVIKLRSPPSQAQLPPQQQQQPAPLDADMHHHLRHRHQHNNASEVSGASACHVDPASGVAGGSGRAAPITAHPRSGSSEFSARYRKSIARSAQHHTRNSSHTSGSRDDAHGEAAVVSAAAVAAARPVSSSPRTTPPPPPPEYSSSSSDSDHDAAEREQTDVLPPPQQQQQHVISVAPTAVIAARARAPVSSAASAAVAAAVAEAVRKPERQPPSTPLSSSKSVPQLTADTVLPVAAQEEEQRFSSSATDTTERSSSSSRQQNATRAAAAAVTSPASSKSSVKTGPSPLSSGRVQKLSQTASDLSSCAVRQRRGSTKQLPHRQSPLSATYSGSGSSVMMRTTAASTSLDLNGRTSSSSAHRRLGSLSSTSVSSGKSVAPALASYSFVSSRNHLQRYIDQWRDRFEEDKTAYKEGGYLTVTPGKIVHSRYVLIQKLGWGEFSTVWLAYDTKHATLGRGATQAFVAVKVAKCRTSVQEATHYEVSLLRYIEARLPPHATVTNIIDCFEVQGEFGTHTCMVMPLCGPNLLSIIDRVKGQRGRRSADDVRLVKEIIISVLLSLHELSVLNVVHTDIKPENVLCCAVDTKLVNSMEKFCAYNKDRSHMITTDDFRRAMAQQTNDHLVCLADFGLSALLEPPGSAATWTAQCPNVKPSLLAPLMRCKKNFNVTKSGVMENLRGTLIQTREYRAPEVLLGLDFTCATDVWSVGCMAFELITGNFLMDPKKRTRDAREMDVEHLAMMMQLIGPLPQEITDIRVRNNDYYEAVMEGTPVPRRTTRPPPEYLHRFVDKDGNFIYAARYRAYPRRSLEMELEPYLGFREARLASNFILSCLCCYDPKNRPSAKKLLNHLWLQGVGTSGKDKSGFR
jgi:serine/threonine protein kinase